MGDAVKHVSSHVIKHCSITVVALLALAGGIAIWRFAQTHSLQIQVDTQEMELTALVFDIPQHEVGEVKRRLEPIEQLTRQFSTLGTWGYDLTREYRFSEVRIHKGSGTVRVRAGMKLVWINNYECIYVALTEVTEASASVQLDDSRCFCLGDDSKIVLRNTEGTNL